MFSLRKDADEESKIDFLLNNQLEIRELIGPLQGNLERVFVEALHLARTELKGDVSAQSEWLEKALNGLHSAFLGEVRAQKGEVLAALQALRAENQAQMAQLREELTAQGAKTGAQNVALQTELREHRAEWRETVPFEMRTEAPAALSEWCDQIAEELRAFGECGGMLRLLAGRLIRHFEALQGLLKQIGGSQEGFEARLEELNRTLFAPELGVSSSQLTPSNCNPAQRRTLRDLEIAVGEFRAHVKEMLRQKTGIAELEIVPMESRFDARFHESNEFLETPTDDPTRHGLILAVEKQGFEKTGSDGAKTLLQMARVRRLVLKIAPENAASVESAPVSPDELSSSAESEIKNETPEPTPESEASETAPEAVSVPAETGAPARVTGQL